VKKLIPLSAQVEKKKQDSFPAVGNVRPENQQHKKTPTPPNPPPPPPPPKVYKRERGKRWG